MNKKFISFTGSLISVIMVIKISAMYLSMERILIFSFACCGCSKAIEVVVVTVTGELFELIRSYHLLLPFLTV